MIINHNMNAMNAHRMMSGNTSNAGKAMEKLSSGLRINRAGDDAAGLAISEKMRGQIRGLDQASRNSQDGISLIQTAEGAANETHSILQRMRELGVQAANDTNVTADRGEIQKEINQLTSEINRIGNTTEFNTMKLLNGERSGAGSNTKNVVKAAAAANLNFADGVKLNNVAKTPDFKGGAAFSASNTITISKGAEGWKEIDKGASTTTSGTIKIEKIAGDKLQVSITTTATSGKTLNLVDKLSINDAGNFKFDAHGVKFQISGDDYRAMGDVGASIEVKASKADVSAGTKATSNDFKNNDVTSAGGTVAKINSFAVAQDTDWENMDKINAKWDNVSSKLIVTITNTDGTIVTDEFDKVLTAKGTFKYNAHGVSFDLVTVSSSKGFEFEKTFDKTDKSVTKADTSLAFQVGANENQAMVLDVNDMRAVALGISSSNGKTGFALTKSVTNGTDNKAAEYSLDVSTHTAAAASVTVIQKAIETVSSERSKLGAYQNRLEHTIANLNTSSENLQASESRVRDVDMAKEMMNFSKNNILSQAAQAMLAQANQQPQGVLQLLR